LAAHLSGELYVQIIEERTNFSMHMTVSGEATGTGKSLFQTVFMKAFHGKTMPTLTSITEAQAYKMLAEGDNIFGNIRTLQTRALITIKRITLNLSST
jgi:hypothetical protein